MKHIEAACDKNFFIIIHNRRDQPVLEIENNISKYTKSFLMEGIFMILLVHYTLLF